MDVRWSGDFTKVMGRFQERRGGRKDLRVAGFALLTAAAVSSWAGAAAAQTARHFGAEVRVTAEYDDNVARRSSSLGRPGLKRKDDYIYSPSVAVDAGMPVGRYNLFLSGDIGYDFHQYN